MRYLLLFLACLPGVVAAGTLLHNVHGYTMDHGDRIDFVAIEYEDGVVTRLYRDAQALATSAAQTRIDGGGATLLPGLIDAHGHINRFGMGLASVDLVGSASEAEAARRVADFLAARDDDGWILGWGWNQVLWPGQAFPHRDSLDAVTGDRPAVLRRVDGHAMWVNSAALQAAGIDRDSVDPEGGQILRDDRGEPTGVLVDNAMQAVSVAIGTPSIERLETQIERGLHGLAAVGLTAAHDAGISARELQAYRNLQAQGRLPIRAHVMLSALDPANDATLDAGPWSSADGMLAVRSVKISADGALGSRGAALHADYSDQPGHRGLLLLDDETLRHHMQRSVAAGFQVNVHAIGDLANTRVLDEFERLNRDPASRTLRHRVEHAQILRPVDIRRFEALDVIASIQPTHATSDKNMAGDRLGEARLRGAYAWNTLLESGARLAGGSDFPVEPPHPLYGLHAAVTRTDRQGEPLGGWLPQEKLDREQSLSLFTEWAAYALHEEEALGRLLPGYAADFVLLKEDYFTQPEGEIWANAVLATVVAGQVVYAAPAGPLPGPATPSAP
jgi:predicted amidohydrolase YtcJ